MFPWRDARVAVDRRYRSINDEVRSTTMFIRRFALATTLAAVLAATSLGGRSAAPSARAAGVAAKQFTIGFANETLADAFTSAVQHSMEKYAAQSGYKLVAVNNNYDSSTALRNANILVNAHVNLAVEFQVDAKIAPAIAATFRKANIPTISIDIPQPGAVFFGANNFGFGQLTGQALGRYAKNHGWALGKTTEVLLNIPAAGAIPQLRMDGIDAGIRQVLPALPKGALIEQDGQGTIDKSQSVMANILPRIPQGNHIIISAINDPSALGALRAVQLAGRENDVIVAGQSASSTALDQMRSDRHWLGDTAYFPEFYGYYVMRLAKRLLGGQTVQPYAFVPGLFIDRSNLAIYYPGKTATAVKLPPGGLVFSATPKHTF